MWGCDISIFASDVYISQRIYLHSIQNALTFRIKHMFCQHFYCDIKCSVMLFSKPRFSWALTELRSDDLCAFSVIGIKMNIQQEEKRLEVQVSVLYTASVKHINSVFKY